MEWRSSAAREHLARAEALLAEAGALVASAEEWLALLAALVGVLWYLAVAFLPGVLTPLLGGDLVPDVEGWPIPTLLIMAGVLTGLLIGLISAAFGGVLGSGVKRRTRSAVQKQVATVSQTAVVEPLLAIREDYSRFAEQIAVAVGK